MSFDRAKTLLDEAQQKNAVRGAVVALGRAGNILFDASAGCAGASPSAPMQSSTIFDLGTLTQPLATATIIMSLASHNGINLNTPACKYWSDFSEDGKDKVSLRHLLKHTSGLPEDRPYYSELLSGHSDWVGTPRGAEFILNLVSAESLEYPPSYTVVMSNVGFMVLGRVAEVIGGSPIDSIFKRHISSQFSLPNSFYHVPAEKTGQCAATYVCPARKKLLCAEIFDPNSWAMGGTSGHAGLFSTAVDSVKIAMGLAGVLKRDGGLWPSKAVDEFIGPKAKYKLGWNTPSYASPICGSHFSKNTVGFVGNTCTSLWIDLDSETAIAVFASPAEQHSADPQQAQKEFQLILPAIHDELMTEIEKKS